MNPSNGKKGKNEKQGAMKKKILFILMNGFAFEAVSTP